MGSRLKTSERTKFIFDELNKSIHLKPFTLSKLAINLSLKNINEEIDFDIDNNGLELHRQTVTGDKDIVFKALIQFMEKKQLSDDEYYPDAVKKHIDRGAIILKNQLKYAGNYERFIKQIINKEGLI